MTVHICTTQELDTHVWIDATHWSSTTGQMTTSNIPLSFVSGQSSKIKNAPY